LDPFRSYLKKVFWPNLCVGTAFQILGVLEYACGLQRGPALSLNQNPIFVKASIFQVVTEFSPKKYSRLELISKLWIAFDGKASADEKAQHTREYVRILNRQITPPSDVRRILR